MTSRRPQAFLQWNGAEFAIKSLNLMCPFARRLPFLSNLIMKLLGQPASVGGRLFYPSCSRLLLIPFLYEKLSGQQRRVQD